MKRWLLAAAVAIVAGPALADVTAPRIRTDKSVDTHSLESIVADVCKPGMTDEQKAIALYEYTRRVMFHFEQRGEKQDPAYDLDALRLINTYGYSFCTQQMLVVLHLWQTAGIDGKYWSVPGHSTAQAFYGGKTHWFDPLVGAYVLSPADGGVAGLKEIADDPTVLMRAIEQGRASPTFMPCGRVLAEDSRRFVLDNDEYVTFCADLKDDTNYMATQASKAKPMGGPRKSLYQPDWTLRPGETVAFLWDNLPGEYNVKTGIAANQLPPNHFCGVAADSRDVHNYPFWRPYAKQINGVDVCRYQASGTQTLAVRFTGENFKKGFESNSFAWHGFRSGGQPYLRPRQAGRSANIVYKLSTPHVYTNAEVTADFMRSDPADTLRLYVSTDAGVTWAKVWDAAETGIEPDQTTGVLTAGSEKLADLVRGTRDFWVRAECATAKDAGKCGLNGLHVRAVFQHNMFARPHLGPGRNTVTTQVANPETLKSDNFQVTWVWVADGAEHKHVQRVTEAPQAWTIDVAGGQVPRMVRLEMAVMP